MFECKNAKAFIIEFVNCILNSACKQWKLIKANQRSNIIE